MDGTLQALKVFSLVDAAAGRWKGARGPLVTQGEDGKVKVAMKIAEMATKREQFLKFTKISEDEKRERAERRRKAADRVRKALKRQDEEGKAERPLRRFGTHMMVVLLHHAYSKKLKRETITRRMVVIRDKMKTPEELHKYIAEMITKGSKLPSLSFSYIALNGKQVPIDSKTALAQWLDEMWAVHPPVLHAFENSGLVDQAIDRAEQIRAIFEDYDKDGSGTIDLQEMTDMIIEMDLTTLGVSNEDILNYVNEEFARADTDNSGEIDFDEFAVRVAPLSHASLGCCVALPSEVHCSLTSSARVHSIRSFAGLLQLSASLPQG